MCGVNKVMAVVKGELPGLAGCKGTDNPFLGIRPEFRGKHPAAGPATNRDANTENDSPGFCHLFAQEGSSHRRLATGRIGVVIHVYVCVYVCVNICVYTCIRIRVHIFV